MIVITGANGQLGGAVIDHLLQHIPVDDVAVSVRDTAAAALLAKRGVQVRAGDFADPNALEQAFTGADQVFIVSVNRLGEEAQRLHRCAIDAAYKAGARRVVYTGHMGARSNSPFPPATTHAASEAYLAESGRPFTALRHGYYAESALFHIGRGIEEGEIRTPEDGPASWTARADLAQADAVILANEGKIDGISPPLTSGEMFTMADLAAIASELTGRAIRHVTLSDEAWVATKISEGLPEDMARALLGSYQASRRGDFAIIDPTLAQLLGRQPKTMREILTDKLRG